MSEILVTERQTPKGLLVAVCDADVLGKSFDDDGVSIDVTEDFYGGDPKDDDAVRESLSRAAVANLVGTRAVELAIEAGYVEAGNVLEIEDTRHAQFLRL